jgi:SAM-dependent methyltransferase
VRSTRDYVQVVYNEQERPLTSYPGKLARHLFERYEIKAGQKLLEVGCGRGEFLRGFISCGIEGYGVDRSRAAQQYCPEAELSTCDVENDGLPFKADCLDVVYSKSVLEHLYFPERLVEEIHRVLKPGGLVITMCPDWEINYRIYFEDYTHRTPFMRSSLRDIYRIHGFENVEVERFRQLPILWSGIGQWLLPAAEITRTCLPKFLKQRSKWVRFSKEVMLLATARKHIGTGSHVNLGTDHGIDAARPDGARR